LFTLRSSSAMSIKGSHIDKGHVAIVFMFLFIIHAIFYIHTIPRGLFPDEKSHLSYIRDIIEGGESRQ